MAGVYIGLFGVALATLNAWRLHEIELARAGVLLFLVLGAGAIYVAARRR
jgi:hypothetical protein